MAVVSANDHKVKVMKTLHIPNDISFSILSKLAIKSLKRFECVCKSWSLLFDDSYFMTIYRNYFLTKDHSYYDGTSILLHKNKFPFNLFYRRDTFELYHGVSGERFDNRVKLNWSSIISLDKPEYDSDFNIFGSGSVHGTLCLICPVKYDIILWNPSSKEFKVIPPSPFFCSGLYRTLFVKHQSFGYDQVRDDYKLIRHLPRPKDYLDLNVIRGKYISEKWEIYSLKSNSWRKFNCDLPRDMSMCTEQLYMDGFSHWRLHKSRSYRSHTEEYLMSFDWSKEGFITTPIPSYINDDMEVSSDLVLLNGSIALILNYKKIDTFHISILGELGVKKSWTKLFIVGPLPCLEKTIGAAKKGDMLFKSKDGRLVWFDLNTQMIADAGISSDGLPHCTIVVHKGNLLPFEGKNI